MQRMSRVFLALCIVVSAFALSGTLVLLLAPKTEVRPVALGDIHKTRERMHRMAFPRMYAEDPEYNVKHRAIINALP